MKRYVNEKIKNETGLDSCEQTAELSLLYEYPTLCFLPANIGPQDAPPTSPGRPLKILFDHLEEIPI